MARIISGGRISQEENEEVSSLRRPTPKQSKVKRSSEDLSTWFGRNLSQEPSRILTDILGLPGEMLQPKKAATDNESSFNRLTRSIPTGEQLRSYLSPQLSPELQQELTEKWGINPAQYIPDFNIRPEDRRFHQIASLAPVALGFGVDKIPKLLKGGAATAAMLATSGIGSKIGEVADEAVGTGRRFFETIGNLAGGMAGMWGASKAMPYLSTRPTTQIAKAIEERAPLEYKTEIENIAKEQAALEAANVAAETQRRSEYTKKRDALDKDILNKKTEIEQKYTPEERALEAKKVAEGQKVSEEGVQNIEKIEADAQKNVVKHQAEVGKLKEKADALYDKINTVLDKMPSNDQIIDAKPLELAIDNAAKEASVGLHEDLSSELGKYVDAHKGIPGNGKTTFRTLKDFHKNLNKLIYETNQKPTIQGYLVEVRNKVSDMLHESSQKHPELKTAWKDAESTSFQKAKLTESLNDLNREIAARADVKKAAAKRKTENLKEVKSLDFKFEGEDLKAKKSRELAEVGLEDSSKKRSLADENAAIEAREKLVNEAKADVLEKKVGESTEKFEARKKLSKELQDSVLSRKEFSNLPLTDLGSLFKVIKLGWKGIAEIYRQNKALKKVALEWPELKVELDKGFREAYKGNPKPFVGALAALDSKAEVKKTKKRIISGETRILKGGRI